MSGVGKGYRLFEERLHGVTFICANKRVIANVGNTYRGKDLMVRGNRAR